MLEHLLAHLEGKVVILGIGNTLRSDDAAGALLTSRLLGKVPYIVYDGGTSPENYLGKIIKDKPDNIIIIDAADFGGRPGEYRLMEGEALRTTNMFSTHNASISLSVNYLQTDLKKVEILLLLIQPNRIVFGDIISPEVSDSITKLENWFLDSALRQ
ncbi:MAG: hydrogenase maturation protease [Candidatus Omnitrophota bacterium]|nr:hydrogenase maturation protease [Candidatus Omnitrophota bacterium]